jgi:hypothetical protein
VAFAAAITVREHVLRSALQAGYANGSDSGKRFTEDLSAGGIGMEPNLFLGQPDLNCEGATNLLVATLPMWGRVTVTVNGTAHVVDTAGEMELTLTPTLKKGIKDTPTEKSVVLDQVNIIINARRWTATVTSAATPPDIAALVTGDVFRSRFEHTFRQGVFIGRITLPSIDASFFGPLVQKSTSIDGRVRNGVLLIGLNCDDADHELIGNPESLQDFAQSNDVAGSIHTDAVDILLDDLHTRLVEGVEHANATLDSFSVRPRDGYFYVTGEVSKSTGSVSFSFRVVPSMFHTRPGAYFQYMKKPRRVWSRTWPALGFSIEGLETDKDRAWWVILFGEVIFGIFTGGMLVVLIEGLVAAAEANFRGRIKAAKTGAPANRIRRTVPPPGGVSVRIGLDQFEIREGGVYVGISVQETPSPALLLGPTTVPATYSGDILRYIMRPPSGVTGNDPALRIRWTLEDRTNNVVLEDSDGPTHGRLRFEFSPASFTANDFGIVARLYRQLGVAVSDIATESVNLHIRSALPPEAYVRWRWQGSNPQLAVDEATDTWSYNGDIQVRRHSEWHRTDEPCLAVNAEARFRYEVEKADRLPFSLRLMENHRKGLCPYCFYGGPAGINPNL